MEFLNSEIVADMASSADLFYGVIEHANDVDGNVCIAGFMYPDEAQEYCEFLATKGRTASVVDFLEVQGIR